MDYRCCSLFHYLQHLLPGPLCMLPYMSSSLEATGELKVPFGWSQSVAIVQSEFHYQAGKGGGLKQQHLEDGNKVMDERALNVQPASHPLSQPATFRCNGGCCLVSGLEETFIGRPNQFLHMERKRVTSSSSSPQVAKCLGLVLLWKQIRSV